MQNDKDGRMMTKRKTRSSSKLMDQSRGKKGRTEDGVIQIDGDLQADWNDLVWKGRARFSYLQFDKKGETKFTLPTVLKYTREEVNLAHYIFAKDLPQKEVLVETMMQSYTRKVLWSLCPKSNVDDDVITAMACQLSLEEVWRNVGDGRVVCYLPAELQEMVINYGMTSKKALECYGAKFLARAHTCRKVCLPMKDAMDGDAVHWYLAVIMLDDKQVHLLDSYPSKKRQRSRRNAVVTMIEFLDDLFEDLYRQVEPTLDPPVLEQFSLTIPSIPEQRHESDSGVWVCSWMMGASWDASYNLLPCGDIRRMQLALYLVQHPTNYIRHVVIEEENSNASRFVAQSRRYKEESQKSVIQN